MPRKLWRHLTYANVTATLALFLAVAGGSAYAINEWNSSNIQDETLLSEDIKNGTLKAQDYGIGSVSGARIQDNNVTTLDLADGAIFGNDVRDNSLTGADVNEATLNLAAEPWHEVGAPGEPPFHTSGSCVWSNFDATRYHTAAFLRDRFGFVHLKGVVTESGCGFANPIFSLPPGYRPAKRGLFANLRVAPTGGGGVGGLTVDGPSFGGSPAGAVMVASPTQPGNGGLYSLDGIGFRCAPSGSNGCP
jgi:hypothetical protein